MLLAGSGVAGPCLSFEPSEQNLTGVLEQRTFASPDEDEERVALLLILDSPICVAGSPGEDLNADSVPHADEIQLVVTY